MSKRKTNKQFIEEAVKIHKYKYDYSLVDYKSNNKKVKIICKEHGEFEQIANRHLKGRNCPQCVNIPKTTKEFIKESSEIHNNKYNYSLVNYVNSKTKVKIICKEHGEFSQLPTSHLQKHGCPECRNENNRRQGIDKDTFINLSNKVHNDKYDYSLVEYKNAHTKVKIICKEHGEFEQLPNNHTSKRCGCPMCNESRGEKRIAQFLDVFKIDYLREFSFNNLLSDKGNSLRVDFYLSDYNTCIEYDGEQHFDVNNGLHNTEQDFNRLQYHDRLKDEYCRDNNIRLIRIPYTQFNEIENILYPII